MRASFLSLCILLCLSSVHAQEFVTNTPTPMDEPDYVRAERLGITFIGSSDIAYSEARYENALALGAGWTRWPLYWDRVEPEDDGFNWARYDELVERDMQHGLQINAILLGVPPWARSDNRIEGIFEPIFADGTDLPAPGKRLNPDNPWAGFVDASVRRYMPDGTLAQRNDWTDGEGIRVWEVWNEPDVSSFWSSSVGDYARLLQVAYIVIKNRDAEATVMFGGLAYTTTEDNWLARVLDIYLDDPLREENNWYMDAVAVHNYGGSWRSGWLTLFAKRTFVEYGITRPVWLNETGLPAWDDYPGPVWAEDDPLTRSLRGTMDQQAAFFVQSAAWAYAEGAEVIFYHQLYDDCGDQPAGSDFPPHDGELCTGDDVCFGDAFGIYRNPPGSVCFSQHPRPDTARPVAEAYQLVAEVFGTERFSRFGLAEELENGVTTITFIRPETDERIVVLWNRTLRDITFELPALGDRAERLTLRRTRDISPEDGVYTLELAAADETSNPFLRAGEQSGVGGDPVIIIESIEPETSTELQINLLEITPTLAPSPTPLTDTGLTNEQIQALVNDSPTGVIFTSKNVSRLRNRPDTSPLSSVVGNIQPGNSATVIATTPDQQWLLIDYTGTQVWVAAFLGEIYGEESDVAALQTIPYPLLPVTPTPVPVQEAPTPTQEG